MLIFLFSSTLRHNCFVSFRRFGTAVLFFVDASTRNCCIFFFCIRRCIHNCCYNSKLQHSVFFFRRFDTLCFFFLVFDRRCISPQVFLYSTLHYITAMCFLVVDSALRYTTIDDIFFRRCVTVLLFFSTLVTQEGDHMKREILGDCSGAIIKTDTSFRVAGKTMTTSGVTGIFSVLGEDGKIQRYGGVKSESTNQIKPLLLRCVASWLPRPFSLPSPSHARYWSISTLEVRVKVRIYIIYIRGYV